MVNHRDHFSTSHDRYVVNVNYQNFIAPWSSTISTQSYSSITKEITDHNSLFTLLFMKGKLNSLSPTQYLRPSQASFSPLKKIPLGNTLNDITFGESPLVVSRKTLKAKVRPCEKLTFSQTGIRQEAQTSKLVWNWCKAVSLNVLVSCVRLVAANE